MKHELPNLPYPKDALSPYISAETLDYHHDKHHAAYVKKLNELIAGTKYENMPLEEIIMNADGPLFNNAAQHWNHTFFWSCMTPKSSSPTGKVGELINKKWGSLDKMKEEFNKSAVANFGSGWTWLVKNKAGDIEIFNSDDADLPMKHGLTALLTMDVWEHAYYIDYRNERPKFAEAYWNIVNWDFVNKNW
jgi:Fe-Mn family superoxide dismutase